MDNDKSIIRQYGRSRDRFMQDLGKHDGRLSEHEKIITQLAKLEREVEVNDLAIKLLEAVALNAQQVIHDKIDAPVTTALRTTYQDPTLQFSTEMSRSGDRLEVDFKFRRGNEEISGPVLDSVGGGVVDVAGFVLRLCIFRLSGCIGPLVQDEPFRHVDKTALPLIAEFVQRVASDMGVQIIFVTHERSLAEVADNVIKLVSRGHPINWEIDA